MAKSFSAQLSQFANLTREKMGAVLSESVQDVMSIAQTPEAQGGRMPVDTGFLRNSLASELNGSQVAQGGGSYVLTAAQMEPGDVARFGWTAAYARRMNDGFVGQDSRGRNYNQSGRHFVDAAAAQWPQIVARNAEKHK